MFVDWQNIAVLLIVLAALAYVGRRGFGKLRAMRGRGTVSAPSCAAGCGTCGDAPPIEPRSAPKTIVQITRTQNGRTR